MRGTIIKLVAGDYTILSDHQIYIVRARGRFRNLKQTPLCGDEVEFSYDHLSQYGTIDQILPRKNVLIRPAIANIDLALIIMSVEKPTFDSYLVDKLLIQCALAHIEPILCVSKCEKMNPATQTLIDNYQLAGYTVILFSAKEKINLETIKSYIQGKKIVLCGQSGVGKSSLINSLCENQTRSVGEYSSKLGRGKHQTRETEFIQINDAFIADTPGFSKLNLNIDESCLARIFKDFDFFANQCKYHTCLHENEPHCGVIESVKNKIIHPQRYQNYLQLLKEIRGEKKIWRKK